MQAGLKDHFSNKVMVVDNTDRQLWNYLTEVPTVSKGVAIASAVFNFLIPGLGTMIAACAGNELVVSKTQLMCALMQLLTVHALFMGWIWAMYWSYLICMKAWGKMPNG